MSPPSSTTVKAHPRKGSRGVRRHERRLDIWTQDERDAAEGFVTCGACGQQVTNYPEDRSAHLRAHERGGGPSREARRLLAMADKMDAAGKCETAQALRRNARFYR